MALSKRVRTREVNYWPSYVDALSTLLLAIIFLLSVFVIAQFLLSREISGQDTVLSRLNAQIAELNELLALERASGSDLSDELANLRASLASVEEDRTRLQAALDAGRGAGLGNEARIGELRGAVEAEREISEQARGQVDLLNLQLAALRQ